MPSYNIFSWNVNGIRAVLKKGALEKFIDEQSPDIFCLQETKAKKDQVEYDAPEYTEIWNSADRAGYSGTAVFTKKEALSSSQNFINPSTETETLSVNLADEYGDPLTEGRIQTVEFPEFFLVNTYVPNSKNDLSRLKLRETKWDPSILNHLKELEKQKPIVICGDFNAAHTEIDLARPKTNHHSAGFTDEERQGISNLIDAGFIDTFRFTHPDVQRYTWWSHWGNARANNVGWRIDYFFISKSLEKNLKNAEIYEEITGSDHCPISITLEF